MRYILKNKDKRVLEFEVETIKYMKRGIEINEEKIKNIHLYENALLPINFNQDDLFQSLEYFIKRRKAPSHRQHIKKIIASYSNGEEKLMDYIDVSLGLSLNDSYWIVPEGKDYQWKDFNLYKHAFNETLELVAFGIKTSHISGLTSSPEFTTNGMLKKCWHRENDKIYLYKGSQASNAEDYGGKEAYSEYYMAQIAEVMEFDYVPYDLKKFHNQIVSSCPIFTNENEGYMPMYYCLDKEDRKLKGFDLVRKLEIICNTDRLSDVFVFDALICNTDRHLGNFGMIVDNNTNEILRSAPIFDNGCSMMNFLTFDELQDIENAKMGKVSKMGYTFDEQLNLFSKSRHLQNLEKLSNFTFKRHKDFNLSEEWLQSIEQYIRVRAKKAIQFIQEKQKSAIQKTADTTKDNQTNFDTDNFNTLSPTEKLAQLQANQEAISNLPKAREFLKEDSTNLENLQEDKKEFQDSTLQQTKNKK